MRPVLEKLDKENGELCFFFTVKLLRGKLTQWHLVFKHVTVHTDSH